MFLFVIICECLIMCLFLNGCYVYMYECRYSYMSLYVYMFICVCVYVQLYVYIRVYMDSSMCNCIYVCI